jgi:DNA-binding transcriptional regulator YdaS (Cro superfamily)
MRCMDELIERAAKVCGGMAKLAEAMGESPQTLSNWRKRGVPTDKCASMELISGGAVSRRDLRPDDWHRIWPELITDEHPAPAPKVAA